MRSVLLGILMTWLAAPVLAGAWPRPAGEWFVSATTRLNWPYDVLVTRDLSDPSRYDTVYVEYGLGRSLTAGLDFGRSVSGDRKSILFLRLPIRQGRQGLVSAVELGLGRIDGETVARPGLSIGLGRPGGWLAADALAEIAVESRRTDLKLDLTWGLNLDSGSRLILQVQSGQQEGDPAFARFAPSIVVPLSERLHVEAGGTVGITGDESVGVKLGLWTQF